MVADRSQLPRGLICPLVTPMKAGDVFDKDALSRLIDYVVDGGVDALLLGDVFWGEGLVLDRETRLEMVCAALEIIQGRWPVLITITCESREATRDLLALMETSIDRLAYGGQLFWVDYPIYYHSNRGLPQWYECIARDTSFGFILGNNAEVVERRKRAIKHKSIRTSVLKRISENRKVGGVIFHGSLKRSMNYHKAVRHGRGFVFYDGDEMAFIRQPSSSGVVAGGANVLPRPWREITLSCLNQYDVQRQYTDHMSQMLEAAVMLEDFYLLYSKNCAAVVKRMLHLAGVLPNEHTASMTPGTTRSENLAVETLLKKYGLT